MSSWSGTNVVLVYLCCHLWRYHSDPSYQSVQMLLWNSTLQIMIASDRLNINTFTVNRVCYRTNPWWIKGLCVFCVWHKICARCNGLPCFMIEGFFLHYNSSKIYLWRQRRKKNTFSLFICICLSLVTLRIFYVGKGGTCAKLTWDDISCFTTMGSPRDQKPSLERHILTLLIACLMSPFGYLKALEVQCAVIIVLQSLEKMRLKYFWSVKS